MAFTNMSHLSTITIPRGESVTQIAWDCVVPTQMRFILQGATPAAENRRD